MGPPLARLEKMLLSLRKAEPANSSAWRRRRHPHPPPHASRTHCLTYSLGLNAAAKNTRATNKPREGPARAGSEQLSPLGGLETESRIWGESSITQDCQKAPWVPARTQASKALGRGTACWQDRNTNPSRGQPSVQAQPQQATRRDF